MRSNDTNVSTGAFAMAIATIMWWMIREWGGVDAPAEVVAASVAIFTVAVQYFVPKKAAA